MSIVWSAYQTRVREEVWSRLGNGSAHIVVKACAGSGKSATQVAISSDIVDPYIGDRDELAALIAFSKDIQLSNEAKLGPNSKTKSITYHSFGHKILRASYPAFKGHGAPDPTKVYDWFTRNKKYSDIKWTGYSVSKLAELCKGNVISNPDDMTLAQMAVEYDVPLYDKDSDTIAEKIFHAVRDAIMYSIDYPEFGADFGDMIFLPNVLPVNPPAYRYIAVDELQDTNIAQRRLLALCCQEGYTLINGVGDPDQAIFAFRGAGATAFDDFREEFNAEQFPLSISYRAPQVIGEFVRSRFPYIPFETPEWAIKGVRKNISMDEAVAMLQPHDMVICRVNADNVTLCLRLLRAGKKAVIRGKDLGDVLVKLVRDSKVEDIDVFPAYLEAWKDAEIKKALWINSKSRVRTIEDRFDVAMAIMEGCSSMDELMKRCVTFFAKDNDGDKGGIMLSSVHKAKGLEAERVFILRPDLLPHPAADSQVERIQEANIEYVANTRTLNELYLIDA